MDLQPIVRGCQKGEFGKMYKGILLLAGILSIQGCQEEPPLIPAKIGNAGSLSGKYGIRDLSLQTIGGGWVNFGYGAVSGYPGASADIGKMGVPAFVEGTWRKGWDGDKHEYFSIALPIDSKIAEQKMRTLQNYYESFQKSYGLMQVVVDNERVQVLYTLNCYSKLNDCTPKENADPNGWVTMSPTNSTEVVVLFDGEGERIPKPTRG